MSDMHRARAGGRLFATAGFGANPGNLRMLRYEPANLPAGAPLVVVLHGCGQSAEAFAVGSGWVDLADRHGFALLCPEQGSDNNPQRCFNWFQPGDVARGAGESGSVRAMIEHALTERAHDRSRVFVTGLSAGGAMTSSLLACYPELFAGGSVVAGLPHGAAEGFAQALGAMLQGRRRTPVQWGEKVRAASPHRGPWPRVAVWHGETDRTVSPANAISVAAQWAEVHGASEAPTAQETLGRRTRATWVSDGEVVVELNLLSGVGHGAMVRTQGEGACGAVGPYLLECEVSAAAATAEFWGLDRARQPQKKPEPKPRSAHILETPGGAAKPKGFDLGRVLKGALSALKGGPP